MKKFILRVMACLMVAAMIGTSFGATKASAAEGKFSGAYVGNYAAEWIPASAFEGCENGAVVTFTNRKATADEGWENPYWNFVFVQDTDGWPKLLDESFYVEGTRPAYSEWEFADAVGEPITTTFSAAGVAKFLSVGDKGLGIQVAGVVLLDWTVTPVAADEPAAEEPTVDEPVTEEPTVDEPVVEEPTVDEPVVEEPTVDEPVAEEPTVDEPVADEPVEVPEVSDNTTTGREVKDGETVYTVQKGDCLWAIARQYLGNGSRYTELFDRNSDILTDATVIIPGQEIIIPAN